MAVILLHTNSYLIVIYNKLFFLENKKTDSKKQSFPKYDLSSLFTSRKHNLSMNTKGNSKLSNFTQTRSNSD